MIFYPFQFMSRAQVVSKQQVVQVSITILPLYIPRMHRECHFLSADDEMEDCMMCPNPLAMNTWAMFGNRTFYEYDVSTDRKTIIM